MSTSILEPPSCQQVDSAPPANRSSDFFPPAKDRTPKPSGHLSYSQVRRFADCPLSWRLSRQFKPSFAPVSLVFGGAFHAGIEAFYRARLEGREAELAELLKAFNLHWARETVGKKLSVKYTAKIEDEGGARDLASHMLSAFMAAAPKGEVVAVEEKFAVDLAPDLPPVVGTIDLVEIRTDADGVRRLHLVDHKTASRKPAWEDLDRDQLLLYLEAARRMPRIAAFGLPLALSFAVTTKTKLPALVTVPIEPSVRETVRVVEKIRLCHKAMVGGLCYPTPGRSCSTCGYARQCAAWPNLPVAQAA